MPIPPSLEVYSIAVNDSRSLCFPQLLLLACVVHDLFSKRDTTEADITQIERVRVVSNFTAELLQT